VAQAGLGKKRHLTSKITRAKGAGSVAQVVENLPSKYKALSSNPSSTKKGLCKKHINAKKQTTKMSINRLHNQMDVLVPWTITQQKGGNALQIHSTTWMNLKTIMCNARRLVQKSAGLRCGSEGGCLLSMDKALGPILST
jgi:hypothetical protein